MLEVCMTLCLSSKYTTHCIKTMNFESMQAKAMYVIYDAKPIIRFEPLTKTSLACLEMCGNYFMSFNIGLFDDLQQLKNFNI